MLGCLLKEMEQVMDAKDIKINNTEALGNFQSADNMERYVQQIAQSLTEIIKNGGGGGGGDGRDVQVGATTTLPAGANATVSESPLSTENTLILDFGIPQGIQGIQGIKGDTGATGATGANAANPIFTIGTVTLGATASVTLTGTYPNLTLNFVLVKGDKGDKGDTGAAGAPTPLTAEQLTEFGHGHSRYEWTGSQNIANNTTLNFASLTGFAKNNTVGDTINFTLTGGVFKTPAYAKKINFTATISLTGTIGGSPGTPREFPIELRRADGVTLLRRQAVVKVADNDLASRNVGFLSFVNGATDPFVVDGFTYFLNNNSSQSITLTNVRIDFFKQ
jgi:hypothetical protein